MSGSVSTDGSQGVHGSSGDGSGAGDTRSGGGQPGAPDTKNDNSAMLKANGNLWRQGPLWIKVLAIVIVTPVMFLTLGALVYAVIVILNFPMPGFMDHVGAADKSGTGEIGDTFGGLLAPILTAGALVATVLFAIQQGNQAKIATQEQIAASMAATSKQIDASKDIFQEELKTADRERERHRAEQVYAWVAETVEDDDSKFWRGVLVINESRVPAQKVDIKLSVGSGANHREGSAQSRSALQTGTGPYYDREAIIPPGKWFIPFQTGSHGDPFGDSEIKWRKLMPVDSASGLFVRIGSPASDSVEGEFEEPEQVYRRELTVHSRTKGVHDGQEVAFSFCAVESLRYSLDSARWLRSSDRGVLNIDSQSLNRNDQFTRDEDWPSEQELDRLEVTPRTYAGSKRLPLSSLTRPVAGFLEFVLRKVTGSTANEILHDAYTGSLTPQANVLNSVDSIELSGTKKLTGRNVIHSRTLGFGLSDGGNLQIPVTLREGGSVFVFPGQPIAIKGIDGEDIKIKGYGNDVATRLKNVAASQISNLQKSDYKPYSEEFWLNDEDGLILVLQSIVNEARKIVAEVKSKPAEEALQ
ncbi:hypothetical protein PGC08_12445 [Brevibacterium sp. BDJS002]|uniref:hypothetical protein n=1 Tax=Brevibacterium sp. BDJS002 TaxID=3020906 RepID=UPI002306FC53|nr:hypothetical protein [Brevibacterium sp. BDJS002]WCE38816.1 hypothetical protein PGC08_12445 [Brevibacterium sp. BDJS002]